MTCVASHLVKSQSLRPGTPNDPPTQLFFKDCRTVKKLGSGNAGLDDDHPTRKELLRSLLSQAASFVTESRLSLFGAHFDS